MQASDWAFMTTRELAADYPDERLRAHSANLDAALDALKGPAEPDRSSEAGGSAEVISAPSPEPAVHNLAPDLDLASLTSP